MEFVSALKTNWLPVCDEYNVPCGTVRVTKELNFHATDLVNAVCRRGRNQAAWTLRYLITHKRFDESDFTYIYVGTVKKIRMVSFANAVKLLMLLPGKLAQANRSKFAQTLYQYYAGDAKLKAEIDRNAGSSEWIHVLAREALAAERLGSAELDHAQPATGEVYRRLYDACSSAQTPNPTPCRYRSRQCRRVPRRRRCGCAGGHSSRYRPHPPPSVRLPSLSRPSSPCASNPPRPATSRLSALASFRPAASRACPARILQHE